MDKGFDCLNVYGARSPRPCRGSEGIVAVFVRSMELGHVLHALGRPNI